MYWNGQVMRLGRLFKFIRTTVTNKLINSVFDTIILSLAQVIIREQLKLISILSP